MSSESQIDLTKKKKLHRVVFHEITEEYAVPQFDHNFDIICIMDVFEHLPNPYDVVKNLVAHANDGCVMVETWVNKSGGRASGPDLEEDKNKKAGI